MKSFSFPLPPSIAARLLLRASARISEEQRSAATSRRNNNHVHVAADEGYPAFEKIAKLAFAAGRAAVDTEALRKAKTIRAAAAAVSGAPDAVAAYLSASLRKPLLATLAAAGTAGITKLPKLRAAEENRGLAGPLKFTFDAKDENAVAWARDHAAELVKDITDTTRQDIADAIVHAVEGGGLDEAFDDILEAIGDESRAELIARTESMTAANEGQRQGWDQAVEAGLLPEDAKRVWIATSGCCDDCDDLDGEVTTLDGDYPDDGGDGPPLHPNCRCTEGIA